MKNRKIGTSGLMVSEIAFGSWLIGEPTNYKRLFREAYDCGINHFDSANIYGDKPHLSEEILGHVLNEFPRDQYVITTKAWCPVGTGPNDRGLGRKHLFSEVENSLRAFGTDYIDVFYCHRFDSGTDLEETLRALDDMITQGKILYIGFSEWTSAQIAMAVQLQKQLGLRKFIASQPEYNLFDGDMEADLLPLCNSEGIGQVVFSVFAQGALTGKYINSEETPTGSRVDTYGRLFPLALSSPERNRRAQRFASDYNKGAYRTVVEKLAALAQNVGVTLPQLALAWVLRLPQISSAIIGVTRIEQLHENIKASEILLSDDVIRQINEIRRDFLE